MPTWLPGVLTAVLLGLVGNYLSIVILVKLHGQAMQEHARRILIVEDDKLDKELHVAEMRRIDGRIDATERTLISTGHRMNGLDLRITSEIENVREAS